MACVESVNVGAPKPYAGKSGLSGPDLPAKLRDRVARRAPGA